MSVALHKTLPVSNAKTWIQIWIWNNYPNYNPCMYSGVLIVIRIEQLNFLLFFDEHSKASISKSVFQKVMPMIKKY